MSTITKERIELFIKNPLENGLTRGEQMELARIALASLEAEAVAYMHHSGQVVTREECCDDKIFAICCKVETPLYAAPQLPQPVVAITQHFDTIALDTAKMVMCDVNRRDEFFGGDIQLLSRIQCRIDEACRAAMLQSGNFRENKNSSTNNFREIAETSTNYPVIPSEVLSAIQKVAKIRADFDDFDGDRRGIGDCLDEAEQELIVTINKYASQLAAEPIAPNDVREQTAIPQVPVTPDGWISCSERMPEKNQNVLISVNFDSDLVEPLICSARYTGSTFRRGEATIKPGNGIEQATHWMPLPEPPQEVNRG